jgi:OmpA-OmpF porin, OOP family
MKSLLKSLVVVCVLCLTVNVNGQIKVDLKKKIESNVNRRVNQRTDQAINKGLDAVEDGIKNSGKENDGEEAREETSDGDGAAKSGKAEGKGNAAAATPFESYSKYDFIPGERVIFYEDFSQDAVGDFPALWNTNGSAEVVTTNLFPGKWMSFIGDKSIWTDELLTLPENYTIEFDVIPTKGEEGPGMAGYSFRLYQSINAKGWDAGAVPGKSGFNFFVEYFGRPGYRTYINSKDGANLGLGGFKDGESFKEKMHQKYHIAVWVQKSRVRLYQDQDKLFDLPKAFPLSHVRFDRLRFEYGAAMISNIRIAVGAPDMRNKLMTEGKLVTYGIYFDVNKDVVKPESYGTLKEIAAILNEVPDVKVKIVGHTDSDGADAANLELSKNRAASVKNELAKSFGVNADRLVTEGAGETQPVAANDSQANKALNRRVEFIKL